MLNAVVVVAGTGHSAAAAAKWTTHSIPGSEQSAWSSAECCASPVVLSADRHPATAGLSPLLCRNSHALGFAEALVT